jgi:hypothetical protein
LSSPTLTWGTGATVSDNLLTGDAAVAPSLHRVTLSFTTVGLGHRTRIGFLCVVSTDSNSVMKKMP